MDARAVGTLSRVKAVMRTRIARVATLGVCAGLLVLLGVYVYHRREHFDLIYLGIPVLLVVLSIYGHLRTPTRQLDTSTADRAAPRSQSAVSEPELPFTSSGRGWRAPVILGAAIMVVFVAAAFMLSDRLSPSGSSHGAAIPASRLMALNEAAGNIEKPRGYLWVTYRDLISKTGKLEDLPVAFVCVVNWVNRSADWDSAWVENQSVWVWLPDSEYEDRQVLLDWNAAEGTPGIGEVYVVSGESWGLVPERHRPLVLVHRAALARAWDEEGAPAAEEAEE